MAVTLLGSSFDTNSGTHTVTATPAVGDLIVVVMAHTGKGGQFAPTDNNSGGGGTYDYIKGGYKNTYADLMLFHVRQTLITSATSTVFTAAPGTTTGGGLAVYKVTGALTAGLTAIRQFAFLHNQSTSTPAPTFDVAPLTTNPVISAVFNATNPGGLTAKASYTRDVNTGWATPTAGIDTMHRDSGETSTAITWGSSSSAFGAVAIEVNTTTPPSPYIVQSASFGSASATDTTVVLPAAPTPGNLLIYFGNHYALYDAWSNPSGWTAIGTNPHNVGSTSGMDIVSVYRVVQSGDTASQTFHHISTADYISGLIIEVTGQGTSWLNQNGYGDSSPASTTNTTASVTPSVVSTLAIAYLGTDTGPSDDEPTPSAGWTFKARKYQSYHPGWVAQQTVLTIDTTTAIQPTFNNFSGSTLSSSLIVLVAPPAVSTAHNLTMLGVGA